MPPACMVGDGASWYRPLYHADLPFGAKVHEGIDPALKALFNIGRQKIVWDFRSIFFLLFAGRNERAMLA